MLSKFEACSYVDLTSTSQKELPISLITGVTYN